jgi:hypothetical protein
MMTPVDRVALSFQRASTVLHFIDILRNRLDDYNWAMRVMKTLLPNASINCDLQFHINNLRKTIEVLYKWEKAQLDDADPISDAAVRQIKQIYTSHHFIRGSIMREQVDDGRMTYYVIRGHLIIEFERNEGSIYTFISDYSLIAQISRNKIKYNIRNITTPIITIYINFEPFEFDLSAHMNNYANNITKKIKNDE